MCSCAPWFGVGCVKVQWLIENFETAEGISLPRSTLYHFYLRHCSATKLDAVNAASFGKLIRSVFLGLRTRRLGTRLVSLPRPRLCVQFFSTVSSVLDTAYRVLSYGIHFVQFHTLVTGRNLNRKHNCTSFGLLVACLYRCPVWRVLGLSFWISWVVAWLCGLGRVTCHSLLQST